MLKEKWYKSCFKIGRNPQLQSSTFYWKLHLFINWKALFIYLFIIIYYYLLVLHNSKAPHFIGSFVYSKLESSIYLFIIIYYYYYLFVLHNCKAPPSIESFIYLFIIIYYYYYLY